MKLAFTGARKGPGPQPNEGRPRPFRKLKIAGGVLAAVSYAIWTGVSLQSNCICCNEQKEMKEKAKLEVQLHAEDSLRRARNWSPRDTQDAYMTGSISNCIYQRAKRLKEATNAGRHSLISDAVDEYEWTRHSGGNLQWDKRSIGSAMRTTDSLAVMEAIIDKDSAGLARTAEDMMDEYAYTPRVNAARWRGALITRAISAFKPMLPEARERKHDSLLLHATVTAYVEECNGNAVGNIVAEKVYEDINWNRSVESIKNRRLEVCCNAVETYKRTKLPDDYTRQEDSVKVANCFNDEFWNELDRARRREAKDNNRYVPGSSRPNLPGSGYRGNGIEYSAGSCRR